MVDKAISEYFREMGKRGGTKRAKTTSKAQRSAWAKKGGKARWAKVDRVV